ncbi:hypothetical protein PG984_011297 [Apiospora sp. TS-2023a]
MAFQIRSSMDEYRKDTDIFLSWLKCSAASHGWIKPAHRKHTTQDLKDQAAITADAGVRLPYFANRAFQSAIRRRERCQVWFEVSGRSTAKQIKKHRHFNKVFRECYSYFDDKGLHEKGPEESMEAPPKPSCLFTSMEVEDLPSDDDRSHSDYDTTKPDHNTTKPDHNTTKPDHNRSQPEPGTSSSSLKADETEEQVSVCDIQDPTWEAACAVYDLFRDLQFMRAKTKELWAKAQRGETPMLVAALVAVRCLFFVRDLEAKVYKIFSDVYTSTGNTYQDMVGVLRSNTYSRMDDPAANDDTLAHSEAAEFTMQYIGDAMAKMTQLKHFTSRWSWPPPVPEASLYKIKDVEFIKSGDFRKLRSIDWFLTQVCMDVQLAELLENDSRADKSALRMFQNPLQMALRRVWGTGTVTVESVFAAALLVDITQTTTPRKSILPTTRLLTVVSVKTEITEKRTSYSYKGQPNRQAEARKAFESGKLPSSMFLEYLQSQGLGQQASRYAEWSKGLRTVPMHEWADFIYRIDPVIVSTSAALRALQSRPSRTAFSNLILCLGDGRLGFSKLVKELDRLVFLEDQPKRKTEHKKKQNWKKKGKKGKKGGNKKRRPKRIELTLSESIEAYIESLGEFCKALDLRS